MLLLALLEPNIVKFARVEGYPLRIYHPNETEIAAINRFPKTDMYVFHYPGDYECYAQIPILNKVLKLTQNAFNIIDVKLNAEKKDPAGVAAKFKIYAMPTVVLKNGERECRIEPNADRSWEQDIIPCLYQLHGQYAGKSEL